MSMRASFLVTIETSPDDFCESDLEEAIRTGIEDVGNYTLGDLQIRGVV